MTRIFAFLGKYIAIIAVLFAFCACRQQSVPKPYGYLRLTMPDTCYREAIPSHYPYRFDVSCHAQVQPIVREDGAQYWIDVKYPSLGATIHCSYQPMKGNLRELTDDAIRFVYRHASHATSIPEQAFIHPEARVYGVLFDLEGNTASSMQFFLTDSVHHFFRAAAYCDCVINADSLAPIYEYLHQDVVRMVESFEFRAPK